MNHTHRFACRRVAPGIALLAMLVLPLRPARGSEVVITVTGTVTGVRDDLGKFGGRGGTVPAGTPFTLVFTFDDTKGQPIPPGPCRNARSGIIGFGQASPATALLTIAGKSYLFGRGTNARSSAWRTIATACSESEIAMSITEGQFPLETGVGVRVNANQGARSLTQDADWRKAVSLSNVYARNTYNSFAIRQPHNFMGDTRSFFIVATVTVSGPRAAAPKAADSEPEAKTPEPKAAASEPNAAKAAPANAGNQASAPHPPSGPPASRIYVLSTNYGNKVTSYTTDGQQTGPTIGLGGCLCTGLAVDAAGRIYVTSNAPRNQLVTFEPDGKPTAPTLNGGGLFGLAVDAAGKIYTLGLQIGSMGVVGVFTPDGKLSMPVIKTGLSIADAIAVDGSGKIYVAANGSDVIKTYDASGQPTTPFFKVGVTPWAIAVAPDGKIYVADHEKVTSYLGSGQRTPPTITRKNPASGVFDFPTAVAVDASGRLYIGYFSGAVEIFDRDGKEVGASFMAPRGISGIAVH